MGSRKQDGFTIVELLVVIAIIAMLVAILLPAVNMARESARNTQCKNNIRNVAVAVNQYHGRMGAYPGFRSRLDSVPMSWVVRVAPDFGERNLYEMWRTPATGNAIYTSAPYLNLLTCPSDPGVREDGPSLSYMANAGRAETAEEFNLPQFGVFLDQIPLKDGAPISATTEAFISDQGDGLGKTLMVAENTQLLFNKEFAPRQTGTRWDIPSPRNDDWSLGNKFSNVIVWHCIANPESGMKVGGVPGQRFINPGTARPASNHSGGVNLAFCDTRVLLIRTDIDYRVYIRLMAPHDLGAARLDSKCADIIGQLRPLSSTDYE